MKILLAVDGSEESLKAVEHVGSVVQGCGEGEITLCGVTKVPPRLLEKGHIGEDLAGEREQWARESRKRLEGTVFGPAKQILREHGIGENGTTVRTRMAEDAHPDVALDVIREAESGGYGVVAMGRRGHSELRESILDGVCTQVVRRIRDCAVWIVE